MSTRLKKIPKLNSSGGEKITQNTDNSFWFSTDIEDWQQGYKTKSRERINEFREHELSVQAFKGKRI